MNIKTKFIILLYLVPFFLFAQADVDKKRDHYWVIGYSCWEDSIIGNGGNVILNFKNNAPLISYQCKDIYFDNDNATIADTSGEGIIYTNGVYIADSTGQIMQGNGVYERIDNGMGMFEPPSNGSTAVQNSLILPVPNNTSGYIVLSMPLYFDIDLGYNRGSKIYKSLINITGNNGLGEVLGYKQLIFEDSLPHDGLIACRHANGRDWWILISSFDNKKIHRFLLDNNDIRYMGYQQVFFPFDLSGLNYCVFTPDGNKYVRYQGIYTNEPYLIDIFDFDRATGLLSNQNHFLFTPPYPVFGIGAAVSSNSRYLYTVADYFALQYDLEAPDIEASIDTIAKYDGYMSPFGSRFFLAQLAPDDKIYVSCVNGENVMHRIENPDSAGIACDFRQHSIQLPAFNFSGLPNFPHFRLGPLDGSASDTLGYDGFRWSSAADFGTRYRDKDSTMTVRVTSQQGYPAKVLSHAMRHGTTYSYTAPVFGEYLPKYGTSGDFTVSFDCSTLGEYRDTLDVFTNFGIWSLPISGKVIDPSTPIDSLAVGLYPNPTSGGLTLQLEMPATGKVTMYSAVGQLVRAWSLDNTAHLEMDLSEYAVGVYFLEIEMGGRKMRVEKVVKI